MHLGYCPSYTPPLTRRAESCHEPVTKKAAAKPPSSSSNNSDDANSKKSMNLQVLISEGLLPGNLPFL